MIVALLEVYENLLPSYTDRRGTINKQVSGMVLHNTSYYLITSYYSYDVTDLQTLLLFSSVSRSRPQCPRAACLSVDPSR